MMDGYGMTTGGWVFMVIFWAVVIAVIAAVALRLLRPGERDRSAEPAEIDPREILDQRYARGEIDTDEYLVRRETLAGRERVG